MKKVLLHLIAVLFIAGLFDSAWALFTMHGLTTVSASPHLTHRSTARFADDGSNSNSSSTSKADIPDCNQTAADGRNEDLPCRVQTLQVNPYCVERGNGGFTGNGEIDIQSTTCDNNNVTISNSVAGGKNSWTDLCIIEVNKEARIAYPDTDGKTPICDGSDVADQSSTKTNNCLYPNDITSTMRNAKFSLPCRVLPSELRMYCITVLNIAGGFSGDSVSMDSPCNDGNPLSTASSGSGSWIDLCQNLVVKLDGQTTTPQSVKTDRDGTPVCDKQ